MAGVKIKKMTSEGQAGTMADEMIAHMRQSRCAEPHPPPATAAPTAPTADSVMDRGFGHPSTAAAAPGLGVVHVRHAAPPELDVGGGNVDDPTDAAAVEALLPAAAEALEVPGVPGTGGGWASGRYQRRLEIMMETKPWRTLLFYLGLLYVMALVGGVLPAVLANTVIEAFSNDGFRITHHWQIGAIMAPCDPPILPPSPSGRAPPAAAP